MVSATTTSREWQPASSTITTWNVLGLGLTIVGVIAFSALHSAMRGGGEITLAGLDFLVAIAITLVLSLLLMVVHELIHGLVMKRYGATPTYGAARIGKVMPVFYCTAPGALFTRRQFVTIALAPAAVLSVICAIAIAFVPMGGWLVVPASIHLGGCVGDFGMTAIVARLAPGTMVEDMKTGMRFHTR